ncbi:MAG: hypothetical protein Q9198_005635 [Flavoplaca austrocitrina]
MLTVINEYSSSTHSINMQFSPPYILLVTLSTQLFTIAYALPPIPTPQIPSIASHMNTSINNPTNTNCHGSLWCSLYGGHFIATAYHLATKGYPDSPETLDWNTGPMNDTAFYAEGAHAVCIPLVGTFVQGGFCVFAKSPREGQGDQPGVTGKMIKWALGRLVERECRMCGSVGDGEGGLITVNYVAGMVCGGICPETRYD